MLNPAALNRKLLSVTGMAWNQFNNPYAGQALNYGNFDGGLNRMARANEYTMVQTMIADRMMSELSCNIVMTDFDKPTANRLLFSGVTLTDTPANATGDAAIQADDQATCTRSLWKEDLPVTDAEVQRTVDSVQGGLGRSCHTHRLARRTAPTTTPTTRTTRRARGLRWSPT